MLAFNLSAELVYTNLLNCVDLAGVPVRAAERRPEHPLVVAGGHCTYNPEPLADFVDFVVLGDGEEVVSARSPRWSASGRRRAAPRARRERGAARARPRSRASTSRRCTRSPTTGADLAAVTPRYPDVPERVEKRTIADLGAWPYPKQPARAAHRGRARPAQRRGVPGLHPGLPVLPGGHDHPPGARAPGRPGAHDGGRRPAPHRLRRGGAHRRCRPPTSRGIERRWSAASSTTRPTAARCRCRCRSLRVDAFTVGIAAEIQKARRTGLTFAPEAGTWRMRQVINKLIREEDLYGAVDSRLQPGLAAGEALLPHRPAHRDRRGHPRHRRARPQLRRDRPQPTPRARR